MEEIRVPAAGEIQIVTLLGKTTFVGWAPASALGGILDSFERVASIGAAERVDETVHAAIRMETARLLRGPDAERLFNDRLAAACLWLALRHWSGGDKMRKGLDAQMQATGSAVVTASVADPAHNGTVPDTAWAFMVGNRVHDGRPQLAGQPAGIVIVTGALNAG